MSEQGAAEELDLRCMRLLDLRRSGLESSMLPPA
jgi:hypothetical protein